MMVIIMIFRKPLSDIFTNDKMIVSQAAKLLLFASIVVLPAKPAMGNNRNA